MKGYFSTSKKFALFKSLSRESTFVLMLLVGITTETVERVASTVSYMMLPRNCEKAPRTFERPMNRTVNSIDECGQSMSNRFIGSPVFPEKDANVADCVDARIGNMTA